MKRERERREDEKGKEREEKKRKRERRERERREDAITKGMEQQWRKETSCGQHTHLCINKRILSSFLLQIIVGFFLMKALLQKAWTDKKKKKRKENSCGRQTSPQGKILVDVKHPHSFHPQRSLTLFSRSFSNCLSLSAS